MGKRLCVGNEQINIFRRGVYFDKARVVAVAVLVSFFLRGVFVFGLFGTGER
jgi:hypothetical protein